MSPTTSKSSPAPQPVTFKLTCKVGTNYGVPFTSYQEAWASNPPTESCEAKRSGTEYSDLQRAAVAAAGYSDIDSLKSLYGLCGAVDGFYTKQIVSDSQAHEAAGMLTLCPDHPRAAQIQANIDKRTAASVAASSASQAVQDGTYAMQGKHLVGSEIQPGTWQSVGAKVEDCYWEVSDSSGNIIDNNFISVAPQFSITIPPEAAGFTNQGCEFERVG